MFFRGREFTIFGSLEPVKPRNRECVKFGNFDSVKKWGHEHAKARSLELSMARTSEDGRFGDLSRAKFGSHARGHAQTSGEAKTNSGNCWRPSSGVSREDIHESGEKQSQSCCPKKSGFRVWTSGRFVNILDEKDILVCVHTRNILWARGYFRYVKVPSSPYKRGREGTCKRIQTFWNLCYLQRESQSLCALTLCFNVFRTLSRVRVVIRIFRVTPQHWHRLADFVVDWTSLTQNLEEDTPEPWIVQCDGAWCYKGVGISAVVTSPMGVVIRYAARLVFRTMSIPRTTQRSTKLFYWH
jgi:hypothetical protein